MTGSIHSSTGAGLLLHHLMRSYGKQGLAILALVTIQTCVAVIYKVSQKGDQYKFSTASTLCLSEFIKATMSATFIYADFRSQKQQGKLKMSLAEYVQEIWSSLPGGFLVGSISLAFLYAFNNNTVFVIFTLADPATINLVKSCAVFVTAVFLWVLFGREIVFVRWLVILLQVFGLISMQWDACQGVPQYSPVTYFLLLLSVVVTSVSSTWNEYLIKNYRISLHIQNFIMYVMGVAFNLVAFRMEPSFRRQEPLGFFEGYTWTTMGVVACNSFIGLAVTAIYKYGDAIAKNMASSITAVVLIVLSTLFFGLELNPVVVAGCGVTVISNYLWFSAGTKPSSAAAVAPSAAAVEELPEPVTAPKSSRYARSSSLRSILFLFVMLVGMLVWISTDSQPPQ